MLVLHSVCIPENSTRTCRAPKRPGGGASMRGARGWEVVWHLEERQGGDEQRVVGSPGVVPLHVLRLGAQHHPHSAVRAHHRAVQHQVRQRRFRLSTGVQHSVFTVHYKVTLYNTKHVLKDFLLFFFTFFHFLDLAPSGRGLPALTGLALCEDAAVRKPSQTTQLRSSRKCGMSHRQWMEMLRLHCNVSSFPRACRSSNSLTSVSQVKHHILPDEESQSTSWLCGGSILAAWKLVGRSAQETT